MAEISNNLLHPLPVSNIPEISPHGSSPAKIRKTSADSCCFQIGNYTAAVVSDGFLNLQEPHEVFFTLSKDEIESILHAENIAPGRMRLAENCLLLDIGGHLVLFDNGMGSSILFGYEAGRLLQNLRKIGVSPGEIDSLVLSHAHSDHCWGTMRDDDTPTFPNARIHISETEFRFWEHCEDRSLEIDAAGVRHHLVPLLDQISFFEDEEEFLPGIRALLAPGHTPGHSIFRISSLGADLFLLSDVAFHIPISFSCPAAANTYDHDPGLAINTRIAILTEMAEENRPVVHYHAPFPGIGHIRRHGEGFRYIPLEF